MTTIESPNQNFSSDDIAIFAQTAFRDQSKRFGIRQADRRAHMYVLGKTGTGKSTLMETLMTDDIRKGKGFALLDPHGDLLKRVRTRIPPERQSDVIDFDVADANQPYGFNPLSGVPEPVRPLACSGLIQVFKHLWNESWGPRLEYILRNCLIAFAGLPGCHSARRSANAEQARLSKQGSGSCQQ
jgi:hypothetical protein